jgi:hypothetical protein
MFAKMRIQQTNLFEKATETDELTEIPKGKCLGGYLPSKNV